MVLNDPEFSEDPILFQEGVEELFQPLFPEGEEIHPLGLIHKLKEQDGIAVKALLLDVPYSKIYFSFANTEAFVADSSEDLQV
ncbi:MAG: hypothetical protein D6785_15965 [Planctomycetota bacterium]|nr:MAG: hypothetical protein D6785_15965 [Planctomycetota bacterium]